jgi:molybdopterin-containing oxidoreductase family molybdopterin binding subunit
MSSQESFVYSGCMGAGCHEGCLLKTYVKDNRIVRTERAELTGPEKDYQGICQKGIEYARFNDSDVRVLYPQKRVGARGEGKWERISWDQAIAEICTKLNEIRDNYGSQSVMVAANPSGYPNLSFALLPQMNTRFVHTFDASASQLNAFDTGFFGSQSVDFGSGFIYGGSDKRLMSKAKHLIIWGSNAIGNTRAASTTRCILDAQENGAKLVHIGVVYNSTAAKCDQFVAVKRGSDAALALAMTRYMIVHDGFDAEYVKNHTVGPLLVRDDNGMFLRESDYDPEGMETNYICWDESSQSPALAPAHTHEPGDYRLTGTVTVAGIACKPAFQKLVEHLEPWTPEYQEQFTGVAAETVRQLTDEYMSIKPADIYLEECLRYQNGLQSYRAIHLLAALSGNIALEGGGVTILGSGLGFPSGFNNAAVTLPEGIENVKGVYVYPPEAFAAADADESPFKAFLCFMGNPMHSNPGRDIWKRLFDKMELIVVHDLWESDTAAYADYLLPDTTTFERTEIFVTMNHLVLLEPAVSCKGEQKTGTEVLSLIARGCGLGHLFDKTDLEYHEIRLQSQSPAIKNAEPPITWERLKKEKIIRLEPPTDGYYNPLRSGDFMTETGRIEFYCEAYVSIGMPMAVVKPIFSDVQPQAELDANPLHLFVGRARLFMQTTPFMVMPDLLELSQKEPWAWVNTADAIERNVNDGDLIRVSNTRGTAVVRAKLTEAVPKGMVNMWLNYRVGDYHEGGATYLQRMTGTAETVDDFAKRWQEVNISRWGLKKGEQPSMEAAMRGKLPTVMNWESSIVGNYDVIWDNRCNFTRL